MELKSRMSKRIKAICKANDQYVSQVAEHQSSLQAIGDTYDFDQAMKQCDILQLDVTKVCGDLQNSMQTSRDVSLENCNTMRAVLADMPAMKANLCETVNNYKVLPEGIRRCDTLFILHHAG